MKRIAYEVDVKLTFEGLALDETAALEAFVHDGFADRNDWGVPTVSITLTPRGVKETKRGKDSMTSKKVLELEKEHAGKEKK